MASQAYHEFIAQMRANATPPDADIETVRERYEEYGKLFSVRDDVVIEPVELPGGLKAEWTKGAGLDPTKTILYFHGGGYCIGSLATHRAFVAELAKAAGFQALSLDYRLAPQHPYPAALEDAVIAFQWLSEQLGSSENIILAGDSAGGGLSLGLLVALRDRGLPAPSGAVAICPSTDMTKSGASFFGNKETDTSKPEMSSLMAELLLGDTKPEDAIYASTLHADLHDLPSILVMAGGWEILLDDAKRFAEKAKAAGVDVELDVWEEMVHVWPTMFGFFPEADEAIKKMATWMNAHM